jgi:4-hydroxybenzoate polyprenyltransferase
VLLGLLRTAQFGLIVGLYVVLTTLYSVYLKHQPVLDLVGLARGFILRLLGGAKATNVPISDWFLIISCFGALFIATGKRQAERNELGDESGSLRATLGVYTDQYLNFLKAVTAGVVLVSSRSSGPISTIRPPSGSSCRSSRSSSPSSATPSWWSRASARRPRRCCSRTGNSR